MTRRTHAAAAGTFAAAVVLASASLGAQGFPASAPAPLPVRPAQLPPFQEATLSNGVRLLVIESHRQPVVSMSLAFTAGGSADPAGKEGVASMVAGLLTKGAGTRTADEISAAIEGAGGSLAAGAGVDFFTVGADALTPSASLAFGLLADAAARPTFPEKEVELARTQSLSALQLALSQPATIASRTFNRELYGRSAYARSATPASVRAITRADLLAFQQARLRPQGALLVVAGDLSLATARTLAEQAFKGWTGAPAAAPAFVAPAPRTAREIVLVHRPGSVQSNILVGNTTFGPNDPSLYAATVANTVIGGGADARLFLILREQRSWTYGAYSNLGSNLHLGSFQASAEVRNAVTDSVLGELLSQLRRAGAEPVSAAEIDAAKNALTGSFPLSIETADQVAAAVTNARLLGRPADFVQTYRTRLSAVTPAQLTAAAKRVVRPEQALVVVVGDGTQIYEKLRAFGPVRIVTAEGAPLTAAALMAPAAPTAKVALAPLAPFRDSVTMLVQGNAFGYQVKSLEKAGTGFRYTEKSVLGPLGTQTTTVTLAADGTTQAVAQTGQMQGQATKIDLAYAGGRVKGSATTPSATGPKSITVDTTVAAGTIDDNALAAIMPSLAWAPGAKFTMNVFQSGKGTPVVMTLTVAGTESVTVPAGTFPAYRAEMTGGERAVTFYVGTAAPHRVLRTTLAGVPVEFVLAK